MDAMKKFFVGLTVAFMFSFNAVAHADEVDSYFAWEIENPAAYRENDVLFKVLGYEDGIFGSRDEIYRLINIGDYFHAANICRIAEVHQKCTFGTDYFDAGLTELTAKLYLEADELEAAEREINLQTAKAFDSATKIRAMNLRAELLNRRGKFSEALELTEAVADLLDVEFDKPIACGTSP